MSTQLIKDTVEHQKELSQAVLNYGQRIIVDIYCRVSTDDQEENTSLNEQERAGREYCKEHNLIIGMVHREIYSGYYYREREKLSLIRLRYREKKIKGIVVRTFDRLSRSQVHSAILMEEMEHLGVEIHCVKEEIDDTIMGKFVRSFLFMVAEMEREKIAERTSTGRSRKAEQGKISVAGYKLPYWLQWNDPEKKDKPVIHPKRAEIMQEVAKKYAKGESLQSITKDLMERGITTPMQILINEGRKLREGDKMLWTPRSIRKMLEDPRIAGKEHQLFHTHAKSAIKPLEPVTIP